MKVRRVICVIASGSVLASCDGAQPPQPGDFRIMVGSTAQVGAVVFEVGGPGISSVDANCPLPRCDSQVSGGVYRVVVAGNEASGHAATVTVEDRSQSPSVTLIEAAGTAAQNYQLLTTGQVTLTAVVQ